MCLRIHKVHQFAQLVAVRSYKFIDVSSGSRIAHNVIYSLSDISSLNIIASNYLQTHPNRHFIRMLSFFVQVYSIIESLSPATYIRLKTSKLRKELIAYINETV